MFATSKSFGRVWNIILSNSNISASGSNVDIPPQAFSVIQIATNGAFMFVFNMQPEDPAPLLVSLYALHIIRVLYGSLTLHDRVTLPAGIIDALDMSMLIQKTAATHY